MKTMERGILLNLLFVTSPSKNKKVSSCFEKAVKFSTLRAFLPGLKFGW